MAATVKIAGAAGTVKINVDSLSTVGDVLVEAAQTLGIDKEVAERLSPVVNGESAALDDHVPDDAVVTAAPQVANG